MPALAPLLSAGRQPLWLDYGAYAGALLANGSVPWLDVAAYVALQRKAQGLLKSDVLQLPVGAVGAAWVAARPALRETMAAKKRAVFPLKTLLADEDLRAHLVELARGLRACFPDLPLALACPSPREWVAQAYRMAHGEDTEVGDDEADSAAVYLADFLRCFGEAGVDVLLLQESTGSEPADATGLDLYQPALNVAAHYRWETGLLAPAGRCAAGTTGLGFVVGPDAILPPDSWNAAMTAGRGLRYAVIPADAQPETVLQRLKELRA